MAAVQRTSIGYGNEGRTKQLAASLSDFIRLFSLYRPASPNKTTHQISCCALLTGGGVSSTGGRFPPLSLLKCTGSGRSAPISALRPARQSVSHLHHLRSPTEVLKVCFSFCSPPLPDAVSLPLCRYLSACVRFELGRAPPRESGEPMLRGRCFKVFSW